MSKTIGFLAGKFLPIHLGHVYAMIKASTMVDELHVLVSYDDEYEKEVLFKDVKINHINYKQRLRWWHQITKDMPHVKVHAFEEKQTGNFSDWENGAKTIKSLIGEPIDVVFSSEHEYSEYFDILYPEANHIIIDADREKYNISATQIRKEGAIKHWVMLPNIVKPYFVKKVVIVGTESASKSTTTRNLAQLYNTNYVEEIGRVYYERLGNCIDVTLPSDYAEIAMEHKLHEKKQLETANKVLFIDTEANVTQYYADLYASHVDTTVNSIADGQDYNLWLLLEPDVEWVDDGTREHGEQLIREENNQKLKKMLRGKGVNYISISGNYQKRLDKAIKIVDILLGE